MSQDLSVQTATGYLHNLLTLEEFHMSWNMPVLSIVKASQLALAPSVQLLHSCKSHTVLVPCSQSANIINEVVQNWASYNCWNILDSEAELATLVVTPGIHLTILVYSKSVGVTATYLLDQLVLQRYEKPRVKKF